MARGWAMRGNPGARAARRASLGYENSRYHPVTAIRANLRNIVSQIWDANLEFLESKSGHRSKDWNDQGFRHGPGPAQNLVWGASDSFPRDDTASTDVDKT